MTFFFLKSFSQIFEMAQNWIFFSNYNKNLIIKNQSHSLKGWDSPSGYLDEINSRRILRKVRGNNTCLAGWVIQPT